MLEGEIFLERRKHDRAPKSMLISYMIINTTLEIVSATGQRDSGTTESLNVSMGGIGLITDDNLSPKQILKIEFAMEDREGPVSTYAAVRWSKYDKKTNKYRAGIEFLALKEKDKSLIKKMMK